jgi:hypothetical protein
MRTFLLGVAVVVWASSANAGVPCEPSRSVVVDSGASTACHYKFRADGSGDILTVDVTLRNALNQTVPNCDTECELVPHAGTLAFSTCCPNPATGTSDANGVVQFRFDAVSGRGTVLAVTRILCCGTIVVDTTTIAFTSTDLNAGATSPVGVTNVFDLGILGGSLGTGTPLNVPDVYANYTCDGAVNVFDLAFFAGGLAVDCSDAACP